MSGDDVTWVMTSSEPLKSEYFGYEYMKVYGVSMCERLEEMDWDLRGGGSDDDVHG